MDTNTMNPPPAELFFFWCKASYVAQRDALHGSTVRYPNQHNHLHLQKQPNRVHNLFEVRVPFWLLKVVNRAGWMRGDYAGGFFETYWYHAY